MMAILNVSLSSISDVKRFVSAACAQTCEIDLVAGRYVVDAKSIMGIFSIDLSKPITVDVRGTEAEAEAFRKAVEEYLV
jgi:phosphotransferase system HPr-like phosphotransfer protein